MKTTVDLPDDLLIQAKVFAARKKKTLKELIIAGLRGQLEAGESGDGCARRQIRWVTADGGLPKGVDLSHRETLGDIISRQK